MAERDGEEHELSAWQYQMEEIADLWCPPDRPWARTGCGIAGAIALALVALPYFFGKPVRISKPWTAQGPLIVAGTPALAFGGSLAALAVFIHFLCFWPYRNTSVCATGKVLAFVVWALSFGYYMWELVV